MLAGQLATVYEREKEKKPVSLQREGQLVMCGPVTWCSAGRCKGGWGEWWPYCVRRSGKRGMQCSLYVSAEKDGCVCVCVCV